MVYNRGWNRPGGPRGYAGRRGSIYRGVGNFNHATIFIAKAISIAGQDKTEVVLLTDAPKRSVKHAGAAVDTLAMQAAMLAEGTLAETVTGRGASSDPHELYPGRSA